MSSNVTAAEVLTAVSAQIVDLTTALNACWTLVSAYLVFLMQLGFTLLEAGSVKPNSTKNIIMQNVLDTCISVVMWWLCGWAISQGDAALLASQITDDFVVWVFLWAFNNCATTIVSGCATSRMKFSAYMCSCIVLSGATFPLMAYLQWGPGIFGVKSANGLGAIDFAGGTVVHIVGGTSAIVAAAIVGPRLGRFTMDSDGKWQDNREAGHSIIYATIGVFLLAVGWMGFNSGSTVALANGQAIVAARCAANSLLAMSAGGIVITLHYIYLDEAHIHDLWQLLNGLLCGLVAITPCCATVPTWAALIIGGSSVYAYWIGLKMTSRLRIDDVVDAWPVHGMCGFYGTLCAGLFSTQEFIDQAYGVGRIQYNVGRQFGIQLAACLTSFAIAAIVQGALFLTLKYTIGVRVSEADEKVGLDFGLHGGYAYQQLNERVKKAHEQMALEQEIANRVRKEMARGRGNKFKEAINSSTFLPNEGSDKPKHEPEKSVLSSTGSGRGEVQRLSVRTSLPTPSPCCRVMQSVASPNSTAPLQPHPLTQSPANQMSSHQRRITLKVGQRNSTDPAPARSPPGSVVEH